MLSQHLPAFASTAAPPFDASIVPVKPEDAIEEMNTLLAELGGLRPNISSAEFESWRLRTRSLLTRALGEHHYMTKRFVDLSWISLSFDEVADLRAFRDAAERARGIFSAAIAEVQSLGDDAPVADESGIDAECGSTWHRRSAVKTGARLPEGR